ncbi:MAG: uroporphyrinogen decarboxylase family protein, partial [Candidatus Latescibacterota bacterium]
VPDKFNTEPDENGDILMYPEGDRTAPPSARMPKGGLYFDNILRQQPLDDSRLNPEDNVEEYGPLPDEEIERIGKEAERLYTETDCALVYNLPGTSLGDISDIPGPGLKHPKGIRSEEEWYVSTVLRSDYVYETLDRQSEIGLENLKRVREALGDRVEVIKITGADFGTQRGPMYSPDTYRSLFKPFHARFCDWIHRNTSWKVFIHTCGGIRPLLGDFIEAGFDIINPVQTSADGMEAEKLKEDFGEKIVFWGGGVDTQKTLPFGAPDEVYREVRKNIGIFNRNGGYVFNAIHNIQSGTPVENILAMIEAIKDSREK